MPNLDEVYSDSATVEVFKAKADNAVSDRISASNAKMYHSDRIKDLKSERDRLLDAFRATSYQLYPELEYTTDDSLFLYSLPQNHQATSLFKYKFQPRLREIDKELSQLVRDFVQASKAERYAAKKLDKVSNDYDLFVSQSDNDIPAIQQISPGTMTPQDSFEKDAEIFSDVLGMEFIEPRVQQYIYGLWIDYSMQDQPTEPVAVFTTGVVENVNAKTTGQDTAALKVSQSEKAISTLTPEAPIKIVGDSPKFLNKYVLGGAAVLALIFVFRK